METRQINLPLDTAKRWYQQGGELKDMALGVYTKQELAGDKLPKTWEEYCDQLGEDKSLKVKVNIQLLRETLRLMMGYTEADKHVAMVKLHILRDKYREGWKPDWGDDRKKCCICRVYKDSRNIHVSVSKYTQVFLSFESEDIAEYFAKKFSGLIVEAGDLI